MVVSIPQEERGDFPAAGSRARAFKRFERDLHSWLGTAEGRFASWSARRDVSGGAVGAESADHDLRVVGREAR
jgi:hypothetical protein